MERAALIESGATVSPPRRSYRIKLLYLELAMDSSSSGTYELLLLEQLMTLRPDDLVVVNHGLHHNEFNNAKTEALDSPHSLLSLAAMTVNALKQAQQHRNKASLKVTANTITNTSLLNENDRENPGENVSNLPSLVWRESTPQNFATANGMFYSHCQCGKKLTKTKSTSGFGKCSCVPLTEKMINGTGKTSRLRLINSRINKRNKKN